MRIGSLCSGIGGLELGLERAGIGTTAWQAEIDPHASEVLARHWPGVPNVGNFVGTELPPCDVLCGGFPCQPVSTAGKRAGTDDERWLFDDICEAVGRMGTRPRLLVFENVRGLLSANGGDAMARVVHGLARLGYVGRYGLLRASDVGAPHQRARLFVAAYATDERGERAGRAWDGRAGSADASGLPAPHPDKPGPQGPQPAGRHYLPTGGDPLPADAQGVRRRQRERARADVEHDGLQPALMGEGDVRWGPYAPAIRRWEAVQGPAPDPRTGGRLSPAFVTWMQGFPEGWVDGLTRTAALRCLGNAVVPQVAERFGRMILGEVGGGVVQPDATLLPTPTATYGGGTAEAHVERKLRMGVGRYTATVTDLGMLVEQVLPNA